ncbi:hypothetical protein M9Y10_029776 [Tritrichomonas musculus]|uniref:Protein kinase domain-containing protein n=1 Tax=Tritrichomonas musculus TaxID=1915356 RepID=A0ABR2KNI1_9EUKA
MKPWEIENTRFLIDCRDKKKIMSCYTIYYDSFINQTINKKDQTHNMKNIMEKSKSETGIMIYFIKKVKIFLFIYDTTILIIDHDKIQKYKEDLNSKINSFLYLTSSSEEMLHYYLSQNQSNFSQSYLDNTDIKDKIIKCIIKKSQYRTIIRTQEKSLNNKNDNIDFDIKETVDILNYPKNNKLIFNLKDQYLYILKSFDCRENRKSYDHEIQFYEKFGNAFHFIRKKYGQIDNGDVKRIILEYIEGETLFKFIQNNKIELATKIKIILEILLSVYFIHSNGFFLRDIKWDNIIINTSKDAILIDFDSSKSIKEQFTKENNIEQTHDIGVYIFTAPEQMRSIIIHTKLIVIQLE